MKAMYIHGGHLQNLQYFLGGGSSSMCLELKGTVLVGYAITDENQSSQGMTWRKTLFEDPFEDQQQFTWSKTL